MIKRLLLLLAIGVAGSGLWLHFTGNTGTIILPLLGATPFVVLFFVATLILLIVLLMKALWTC